jgi:hypothetical protein
MKYLYLPLRFEHVWLLMPILLLVIFIPESAAGIYLFRDRPSFQVFFVILLGLLIYCFSYVFGVRRNYLENKNWCNFNISVSASKYFSVIVLATYFTIILYAALTSEKIALWEAFRGASASDVALARESLFKSRIGWERLLPYANAVFSTALMPFVLVTYYLEKRRFRHIVFIAYVVSLLLSLEKVLVLKALLPLIVLGCNGFFSMRRVFQFFIFGFMVVSAAFYFSKMGVVDIQSENKQALQTLESQQASLLDTERDTKRRTQDLESQQASLLDTERDTKRRTQDLESQQASLLDTERDTKRRIQDLESQQASLLNTERDTKRRIQDLESQQASLLNTERNLKSSANGINIVNQLEKITIARRDINKQLEYYTIEQPKQIKTARKSINKQLEYYTVEQPRQIESARKAINEQLEYYAVEQPKQIKTARKSINKQLEYYAVEQPKQIKTARKSINKQLEYYNVEQPRQIESARKAINKELEYYRWASKYTEKYNIFGSGQIAFAFNRVFWIPYITAYDWLGFWENKFAGSYLLGRTSGLISQISNQVQFPMEQEVFKYQFGGGVDTATANACFLIDAFVNFGWLGVIIYAAIFAALTRIIVVQGNPAMMACYPYFVFQASMGGMAGVLFSNGMLLLILIAFFIKPNLNHEAHA